MADLHSATRVWETTTDISSPFDLDGVSAEITGLRTFVAAGVAGKEVFIMEQHQTQNEWQLSRATITDATPDTYVINQVIKSSNSDAQVTWTAGTRDVFLVDYHGYSPGPQHTITGATTLDESHYELICNFASDANVTFPPVADYQGKEYVIKSIGGAGVVTLVDDAGDTNAIEDRDGTAVGSVSLAATEAVRYRSDGTKWRRIGAAETGITVVTKNSTDGEYTASANEFVSFDVSGGAELVTNGDFISSTGWTFNSGWSHDATDDEADASTASTDLERAITVTNGTKYVVRYRIANYSAGSVVVKLAGTSGTSRSAGGYYKEVITAGAGANIEFTGTGFTGSIDDVSVVIQMALKLPIAANVNTGDIVTLHCSVGDADGSVQLLTGATGDLLDGVDHSVTEKTNLFQAGETYSCICVDGATGDWATYHRSLIPCQARMRPGTALTVNSAGVSIKMETDTAVGAVAGNVADTVNNRIRVRREGTWVAAAGARPNSGFTDQTYYQLILKKSGATVGVAVIRQSAPSPSTVFALPTGQHFPISEGGYIELFIQPEEANIGHGTNGAENYVSATEVV